MERSIQQVCTNRSRAWPQFAWDSESQRKNVSSDYSVLKARPSKKHWTKYNKHVILVQSDRSVSMTVRFHLFPFRTQKLSSLVPKIVRWKRRVKIGSRRLEQKTLQKKFWSVFLLSWNRFRRKQKGRYALKMMWALKMKQTGREGHNFMQSEAKNFMMCLCLIYWTNKTLNKSWWLGCADLLARPGRFIVIKPWLFSRCRVYYL